MISSFEKSRLRDLLKDFYTVVGIRISVFDDELNIVTEYPDEPPELCRIVRSTDKGIHACRECDIEACHRAKKLREPHVYTCHAGLTEAITPIRLGGGVIGYAIFAHMMPEEGGDEAAVREAVGKIKRHSREKIIASVRLLDAIASYMQITNLASWKNEDVSRQINAFIENNLREKLDSDTICRQFYISRTKLYQISVQSFGMGIAQYVTYKRIERAKKLMRSDDMTVTAIAREVGVDDYNYFCKLFRKAVGVPPGKYKAALKREERK